MNRVKVDIHSDDDHITCILSDDESGDMLNAVIEPVLEETSKDLELDLKKVTYLDSSSIGFLIKCKRVLEDKGLHLAIRNPSPQVVDILKLSSLGDLFGL